MTPPAAWPICKKCKEIAQPGRNCDKERCPFVREDGKIATPKKG